ncbi:hypothetical protein GCM10017620_05190 [Brevundimonas intermedia]|uniref:Transposase n=2 Tax=Brevundimonas intermedia TaxID=74315 RepID=A0ABQ5T6Y8_9CAUL|nr:hypothetical protein GCM10017620_05190 [Brevundimonas intermedia]
MIGMTDDLSNPVAAPPSPWTRRSPKVWAAARADYLAGAPAAEVCERHGLSLSTFRWRARTEAWRLCDQTKGDVLAQQPPEDVALLDAGAPCSSADIARLAWANVARAVREGRLIEARGWTRLHQDLFQMANYDKATVLSYAWATDPESAPFLPEVPPLRPREED